MIKASRDVSKHILTAFFVFVLFSGISLSPLALRIFSNGVFQFLSLREASAQSLNPQAKSKYEAALAMQNSDCNRAKALLKQAIALDPRDRSERVGMFATDYFPNAKLRALEARCPSTQPVKEVPTSIPSKPQPPTVSTSIPSKLQPPEVTTSTPSKPQPPAVPPLDLILTSPTDSKRTVSFETDSLTVKGSVKGGEGSHEVTINNKEARVESSGAFSALVPIEIGRNDITVKATDSSGKAKVKRLVVTRAAQPPAASPPSLNVMSPSDHVLALKSDKIAVKGSVKGGVGASKVTVNNKEVRTDREGSFSTSIPLVEGENKVTVKVRDSAGKEDSREFLITRLAMPPPSAAPPVLSVSSPLAPRQSVTFETDNIAVEGSVTGGEGVPEVTVNNKNVQTDSRGSFSAYIPLATGENKVSIKVKDSAGKEDTREFLITRLAAPSPAAAPPVLSVSSPLALRQSVAFETDNLAVAGSVSGGEGATKVTINDREVKTDSRGSFSTSIPLVAGDNKVTVKVRDSLGKEDSRELFITRLPKVVVPPPVLYVASPSGPKQSVASETDNIAVAGSVSGGEGVPKVTINDREVKTDSRGSFSASIPLIAGENKVTVKVRDSAGKEDSREFLITRLAKVVVPPPVLTVASPSSPRQSVTFETDNVAVAGSVSGGEGATKVTINDREVKTDSRGSFSTSIPLIAGDNKVTVKVRDSAGREEAKEFLISRRPDDKGGPPVLDVGAPTETGEEGRVIMQGTVRGGTGQLRLVVDGQMVPIGNTGYFSTTLSLKSGKNKVLFRVEDSKGQHDDQTWLLFNYPPARR